MSATSAPDIVTFTTHKSLLGLSISPAQETLLRGLDGLPLANAEQREIWQLCTERPYREGRRYPEATIISGARSGKDSRILAPALLHAALFGGYERLVAKGERGVILLIAQDARAARIAFDYARDYVAQSPALSQFLDGEPLASSFRLKNGLEFVTFPSTLRSMRGYSIAAAGLDEVSFFRLEGQADSDVEIQASIRRGMIAFGDRTRLIKITTPFMRDSLVGSDFARSFGKDDEDLLVWRSTSRLMNPAITERRLAQEQRLDPLRFRREYLAEFIDGANAFLPQHLIDAAVAAGRRELPPREGVRYTVGIDPSGGGGNFYTLARTVRIFGRGVVPRRSVIRAR